MGDYFAYEATPGSCLEQVRTICQHITDNQAFGGDAAIKESAVDVFITSTYWQIVGMLAEFKWAYNQTSAPIVGMLEFFNALGAAAKIELAMPIAGFAPKANNRFGFLWTEFHDGLLEILSGNSFGMLGGVPLADPRGDGLTAGGISLADKDTIGLDIDNEYSFRRKLMDNPFWSGPSTDFINREITQL